MAKLLNRRPNIKLPKVALLKEKFHSVTNFFQKRAQIIQKRPIFSFLVTLAVLFVLIAAGNFLFKPKTPTTNTSNQAKSVQTYTIGSVPKVTTQAQIQNSGVITIMALSGGVVQSINISEGDSVQKNSNLISLSSNYSGGNAPAIQQEVAAKQYQLAVDTFNTQKEIIQKQRDSANLTDQNSSNLRDISAQSIVDLQAIADLNNEMLVNVQQNISDLEALPTDPTTTAQIAQLKQAENQLQLAQNQTHQQLLNTQYQANPSNPPTQLADLQKDITLKQLDIQEKSLQNSKDIAGLQVALAAINTSLLHPTAPFGATIEKVLVRAGQQVTPGTPLIVLSGDKQEITAVAKVPAKLAQQISSLEDSAIHLGNNTLNTKPDFVSSVPTDGLLYSVIYTIPQENAKGLTDNEYVSIDIPVGVADTTATTPFIPLDSVFQTQDHSYIYVVNNGVAQTKTITTGNVTGNFVEVTQGLSSGDQVILDRNVVEGDKVQAQ